MEELDKSHSESPVRFKILCSNEATGNAQNLTSSELYEVRVETDVSSVFPNVSAAHHVEFHDSRPYHVYSFSTTGAFPEDFYFLGLIWIFLLCLELLTGI